MSFARNFAMGQQIAQTAMDAFDNARLGAILGEAEKSKPDTLNRFSDEDAKSIHDAAAAGKEVAWDEDSGGYAVKPAAQQALPSAAPEEGSAQGVVTTPVTTANVTPRPLTDESAEVPPAAAPQPAAAAQQPTTFKPQTHTTYLDKTTVGTLTPEQIGAGKTDYIKGRASELFNPNLGLKRLREMRDEDREDFKWGLLKTKAAQEAKELQKQQDADKAEQEEFGKTATGQALAQHAKDVAAWQKTMAERDAAAKAGQPMPGDAPPMPQMPAVPLPQSIADTMQTMFARQQAGGKVDMATLAAAGQTLKKAQDEGVTSALRAAQDGATIEQIAKMFEGQGAMRFDPAGVTSDTTVQRADGMTSRVIQYTNPVTGKSETIDTLADLSALGKAGEFYKRAVDGLDARGKAALRQSQINYNNARAGLATSKSGGAAIPAAIPAGGATGATVAPDTAQLPSLADATVAHIAQLNASAPAASKFTPQYSAAVNNVAINLAKLNPGGNVRDLAELSMQIQDGTPLPSEIHFDAATGSPVRATPSARSPGAYTVLGRTPDVSALSKDERGQLDSSLSNQAAKLGLSPNQLRMAAKSPEQAAGLRALLLDQAKATLQAQADKAKQETGRDVAQAQIDAAHKESAKRIDALLRLSTQLYGAR